MSPAAAFHAQLASIMEVLANTAVAEICELVDSGYAVLQLEISRSRKENELLRRKLRLTELRAARAAALRAAAAASGTAPLLASGRARAQLPAHRPGSEPRRSGTPAGEAAPSQQTLRCGDPEPAGPPTAGIKVEDVDGCWSQPEPDSESSFKEFCRGVGGRTTETEAPPPRGDQEVAEEGGGSTRSWLSGEVSSTSASVRNPLSAGQRSEPSSYDGLMYEPQLQHGSRSTQNPLGEDPGCSYALNASGSGGGFPFAVSEASLSNQQGAPLAADEPQLPVREEVAESQSAFIRRDRWKPQDVVDVAPSHRGDDGGAGKAFVCNCCGKTLACLKNLKTHMRVHTGEKPFVCALCGKRFSDSSNLKRHQSVHTGEKRYGCAHCGKRFAQSGSLKVHMSVHTECKQFRCSYCGKTFISGSHLRRHVTVHGGEKRFAPALQ